MTEEAKATVAQKKSKLNIPMTAACILLCLTLFSFHFTGGLYARYITTASGDDSARVAKFHVTDNFEQDLSLHIAPGEATIAEIHVKNESEVAVSYIIKVENKTKNIPYEFYVTRDSSSYPCPASCDLAPGAEADVTVFVNWNAEGALAYMGMVDLVTVSVTAQQID